MDLDYFAENKETDDVFSLPINDISDSEILELFFKENGIEEYIEKFKQEKVFTSELIKELTDDDLEKLGVSTLGERKKVLKLFHGVAFDNFRNEVLYQNLTESEKSELPVKENEIIKQNECKFQIDDFNSETGTLILYINRIEWKGYNHFVIAINKISDVSVRSCAANSTLSIKAYDREFNFTIRNSSVAKNAVLASLAGLSDTAVVGVAMMNDKPITDIEFWRQKLDYLRDYNRKYPNTFGISEDEPIIKEPNIGCGFPIYFAISALIITLICVAIYG